MKITNPHTCSVTVLGWALLAGALLAPCRPALGSYPAPVPATGQLTCYDTAGNQEPCAGTGEDGELQAGTPWPAPRFRDNGDGTITDLSTGLAWTGDANAPGPSACSHGVTMDWSHALDYVKCLNSNSYLNYKDWRLPNVNELRTLFDGEEVNQATWLGNNGFKNIQSARYKTSTSGVGSYASTPWVVNLSDGTVGRYSLTALDYVWPVRTDAAIGIKVPKTGQTLCYDFNAKTVGTNCAGTGQDGELQAGVTWPATRFAVNTNTVVDNLTGLEWVKEGKSLSCGVYTGQFLYWWQAPSFVSCLNSTKYLGNSDWRLPNINELFSLSNAGVELSTWLPNLSSGGFNLDFGTTSLYWSSTTYPFNKNDAWTVSYGLSGVSVSPSKQLQNYVLPVRNASVPSGQSSDTTAPVTTVSPAAGTYVTPQTVTLSCSDSGSGCQAIYYTTNGNNPTTSSSIYSAPITVSATTTVKFFSTDKAGNLESPKSVLYSIPKRGDINMDGKIDTADAVLIYNFWAKTQTPTANQATLADVAPLGNDFKPVGNNKIDLGDVVTILRYLVGAVTW